MDEERLTFPTVFIAAQIRTSNAINVSEAFERETQNIDVCARSCEARQ